MSLRGGETEMRLASPSRPSGGTESRSRVCSVPRHDCLGDVKLCILCIVVYSTVCEHFLTLGEGLSKV